MRLSVFVICFSLSSLLFITAAAGFREIKRIDKRIMEQREQVQAVKFISESFEKTCEGSGFEDLNEWQITCRSIWNLEYIGWCNSDEFMIDTARESGILWYGKWIGCGTEGEIYYRERSDK